MEVTHCFEAFMFQLWKLATNECNANQANSTTKRTLKKNETRRRHKIMTFWSHCTYCQNGNFSLRRVNQFILSAFVSFQFIPDLFSPSSLSSSWWNCLHADDALHLYRIVIFMFYFLFTSFFVRFQMTSIHGYICMWESPINCYKDLELLLNFILLLLFFFSKLMSLTRRNSLLYVYVGLVRDGKEFFLLHLLLICRHFQ